MISFITFLQEAIVYVYDTLIHNALFLMLGIVIVAIISVHVDPEKFKNTLLKRANVSIAGSVAFGAFTPFCACGTMAVIVGMMATALPWGPVMAFLTSSPLMSPDMFVMISGILGTKFAVGLTVASLIIGLGSGYLAHFIERNTQFLDNQTRLSSLTPASNCCGKAPAQNPGVTCCSKTEADEPVQLVLPTNSCCCGGSAVAQVAPLPTIWEKLKVGEMMQVIIDVGVKKVLVNFAIFAAIAYIINKFIPTDFIARYLGAGNIFAVPVSALVGLPLYVSGPSSIPLIDMLMKSGASGGAMLAFMITGPGTSGGVIAGISTIMKRRAIALYVSLIFVWSILLGYGYDILIRLGM